VSVSGVISCAGRLIQTVSGMVGILGAAVGEVTTALARLCSEPEDPQVYIDREPYHRWGSRCERWRRRRRW